MAQSAEFPLERFFFYQTAILAAAFLFAPLFPQLMAVQYTFAFRSALVLLILCNGFLFGFPAALKQILKHPSAIPLLIILALAAIGSFHSPDIYRAKHKTAMLLAAFLIFCLGVMIPKNKSSVHAVILALAWSGVLAACAALWKQWAGHAELLATLQTESVYPQEMQAELIKTLQANRAMGEFGNPNHLAAYLAISLWCVWHGFQTARSTAMRIVYFAAGFLLCVGVYQTYSRSGLLLLAFSLMGFAAIALYQRGFKIPRWAVFAGAASIALSMIALYALKDSLLGGRLLVSSTLVARWHFFRGGLMIIQDHAFFGVGTEGFEAYFSALLRPGDLESRYVHNIILEFALEWGVPGLFALAFLLFSSAAFFYRQLRRNNIGHTMVFNPLIFTALGTCACLFLVSLVDFHNNLTEMLIAPMFLLGAAFDSHSAVGPLHAKADWKTHVATAWLVLIWAALVLSPFANRLSRQNGYYLSLDRQPLAAREAYEWAVFADPADADSWNHLGHLWKANPSVPAQRRMLESMQNAVYWAPRRATLRADLADAYFALGYADRAIDEMQNAQTLFPARPAYHERLAECFRILGDDARAKTERDKANELERLIEERKL